MEYALSSCFLVLLMFITDTNELSVNISPYPATITDGKELIVTSIISKTESESWTSFTFYVKAGESYEACGGAFYSSSTACTNVFQCAFTFNCNYTHFNLRIAKVSTSMSGMQIYAETTFGGSEKVQSVTTILKVEIPLTGVVLSPSGTITKTESEIEVFHCSASSRPVSKLSWRLGDSLLQPQPPYVNTEDTVKSTYRYTAQKDDNGIQLSCTAVYESKSFTEYALLNVLYRPIATIVPTNKPYRVLENTTNLILTCTVEANPGVSSFTWKKDGSTISGEASTYTVPTVYKSHAGNYICGATNSVGSSDPSAAFELDVLYGVEMNAISKRERNEGSGLFVTCSGLSNPVMTDNDVNWTKENNITFRQNGTQLIIDNVNRLDSGTYVCSVVIKLTPTIDNTIVVTGRTTLEVDVLYRPNVTINPKYMEYKVVENTNNLELNCTAFDTNPAVRSYRWYKDNRILDGFTDALYIIPRVLRSHTGSYRCDAENSAGTSDISPAVLLIVLYGVDINPISKQEPTELTQMSVSCNVKSYPEVTNNDVSWTKQNNATFSSHGQQLIIRNVQRIDSGTYICSVVITLAPTIGQPVNATGTTSLELNVLYRPIVTVTPDYNQYNVIENTTNLKLECNVKEANPAVTSFRWFQDSSVISNDATYTISTVFRRHTGLYKCDATNYVGPSVPSMGIQLNVQYGVHLFHISKKQQLEGSQLTVTCSGQSHPLITNSAVEWSKQKNATFSSRGTELVIDNLNRLDRGTYVCSVVLQLTPTVGQPVNVTGTTTVEVEVLYRPDVTVFLDKNPYSVTENTTNLHLTCNVTDAFPKEMSYSWYKDGLKVSTAATYTLSIVRRSHTGYYTCDATNIVGSSDPSSVVQLDVLYGVSLELSRTEIRIKESESWELSCMGAGNPIPQITCVYGYNKTTVGEQRGNVTTISAKQANCADTGFYVCSGNNTIGELVTRSADVEVACRPRTYNDMEKENIFISGTDENLNISTTFISFPISKMAWFRELSDGNLTDLNNEFIPSIMSSQFPYETISKLQKVQLKQDDFGIYLVNASNMYGSFVLRYYVIAKRAPDAPTNITASCDISSIKVTWMSSFNGGENQIFRINLFNDKSNKTISKEGIADKERNDIINAKIEFLSPDTLYLISLNAINSYGTTKSKEIANCSTQKNQENNQPVSSAVVGGITGSISALLIVIIVIGGLYLWRRRQDPGVDNELIHRRSKETDEDEDGLKENPLYVTSGETSNADVGPVYGVVNKQKQKRNITFDEQNDQGPVYSQVKNSNMQGKKKQHEKKTKKNPKNADTCKDIELGTVYENSDKLLKNKSSEELYANAGEQGNCHSSSNVYSPKKNKDGLIYADLDLTCGLSGKKFVIRGLENRTNYAMIDLSIKVDPLPSDDEDEDKEIEKKKLSKNESNE